jgi:hypothetical protein
VAKGEGWGAKGEGLVPKQRDGSRVAMHSKQ